MSAALPSPGMIAQVACLLEATARKPGNVHRFVDFADATYLDFALSAGAIVGALDRAAAQGLGATIEQAVTATRAVVTTNTNLGLILLLAPLTSVPPDQPLRAGLELVLGATTVEDARALYRAIRLASPGGLGRSSEGQDVRDEPTVTLVEAMRLAAGRDLVARQYATGFADVFDRFVPALAEQLARPGRSLEAAIVAAYLRCLAERPDTLIARKRGEAVALEASSRAARVVALGWPDAPGSVGALADLDAWLRADGHARNPGATADLAGAGLFVALRTGIIGWPVSPGGLAEPVGFGGSPSLGSLSVKDAAVPGSRSYKVRVTKDDLVFASGHFITFNEGQCERLHGHNYRVAVEVEDDLKADRYVFDFVALLAQTRTLVGELDHRMLLPGRSNLIQVEADGPNWRVSYQDRRWSFPQDECVILPLSNTTAELLADYLLGRLLLDFEIKHQARPRVVRVEVEESFGQSGAVEWRRES